LKSEQIWFEGGWFNDPVARRVYWHSPRYVKSYEQISFDAEKGDIDLTHQTVNSMVPFLEKEGFMLPKRVDRDENDVKMLNRMLDIIEKNNG